jgi:hypothetical protein
MAEVSCEFKKFLQVHAGVETPNNSPALSLNVFLLNIQRTRYILRRLTQAN